MSETKGIPVSDTGSNVNIVSRVERVRENYSGVYQLRQFHQIRLTSPYNGH